MLELYPFQHGAIAALREGFRQGHKRQLLAAATGSGKTVISAHMIERAAAKGKKSLFVVDRIVLVDQAARHLHAIGLTVGLLQAENSWLTPTDDVVVASIQTLARRKHPHGFGLIVIDECHILHKAHIRLMERLNAVPVVGLSATPLREDLGRHFTNLVRGPRMAELMDLGYLVRPTVYCPRSEQMERLLSEVGIDSARGDFVTSQLSAKLNRKELIGDIVATWQDKAEGLKTIVFAVDVAHSKAVCDDFLSIGVPAEQLDYTVKGDEREAIIKRFRNGETSVLTSVNTLGLGFDVPNVVCGIMARPTLSEALFIQQAGRILRTCDGKDRAILLDHAGNTLRFGLPQDFVVPDLGEGEHKSGSRRQKAAHLITCSECNAVMEADQRTCLACGVERKGRADDVTYIDGDLAEFGNEADPSKLTARDKKSWYLALKWHAQAKGYKAGWAFCKYCEKFGEKPSYGWRSVVPQVPTDEQSRWIRSQQIRWAKRRKRAA